MKSFTLIFVRRQCFYGKVILSTHIKISVYTYYDAKSKPWTSKNFVILRGYIGNIIFEI